MAGFRICSIGGALLLLLAGLAHPVAAQAECEDPDLSGPERLTRADQPNRRNRTFWRLETTSRSM